MGCLLRSSVVWGQVPGGGERGAAAEEATRFGRLPGQSQEGWASSDSLTPFCLPNFFSFFFYQIISTEETEEYRAAASSFRATEADWIGFLFPSFKTRAVWEHGSICQKYGHVGKLWGQHGPVPGFIPAGRGGGQDGAAASGAGSQWLLHLWGAAGWLYPPTRCYAGKLTAAEW